MLTENIKAYCLSKHVLVDIVQKVILDACSLLGMECPEEM